MDKTALHYRYEDVAAECLIGIKFYFMKGRITDIVKELKVSSKENMIDRTCDLCLFTDADEIFYVEIISKHKLTKDKIDDYYFSNLNCLRIVVPEKDIHCNLSDETIKTRLLQSGSYDVISKTEDYKIKINPDKVVTFSDFDNFETHVDFVGDDGIRYSLLKGNYRQFSDIDKGIINGLYQKGQILLEIPNYDCRGTLKENILDSVSNYL